ncbi:GNAT family N-acetyltransferase [Kineococcus sp. LSe6-4]|uniref:GNAT family N-acetyltransferase n=1 Tax=Kineococcus halophytocola TaxID=3234027 RepID=A0ABV4GWB5_9ACTN
MAAVDVRPATAGDLPALAWLWQCFRHDLAALTGALPYADGRYQTAGMPTAPQDVHGAVLAWRPHPRTGRDAPVGFAVAEASSGAHELTALWVAVGARRDGVGRALAVTVLRSRPGPWRVGFQHANAGAGTFWRTVAGEVFGPGRWREERVPAPHGPDDHLLLGR